MRVPRPTGHLLLLLHHTTYHVPQPVRCEDKLHVPLCEVRVRGWGRGRVEGRARVKVKVKVEW